MKGKKAVILVVILTLIAISAIVVSITIFYQNNPTQIGNSMSIEGTVAKVDDARMLVISGKDATELDGQTEQEMLKDISEAIWFTLSIDQLKKVKEFDSVRVTYSQIDQSSPGQASADSVEIIK
ncbi:YobA family protein [Paenisporosarcina sp. TG-14]|uniref:YobA family protein n=1 Tax=Paenisporosarcina sp. TG-14 TaxID=1231057 RepID=UPI0002E979A7|nr:YobA family protein [Paenisporosarcina sp. TG-14]